MTNFVNHETFNGVYYAIKALRNTVGWIEIQFGLAQEDHSIGSLFLR